MQTSLDKLQPPPQKLKNILIRHTNKVKHNRSTQHPEVSYILKYSPKYYKSLKLEITPHTPLVSKIKKIKKLREFTGTFSKRLPVKIWFNILANTRKEIEANPQISPSQHRMKQSKWFWKRLNLEKIKFFPNMKRVLLPIWKLNYLMDDSDNFFSIKELFVSYLWNMRRLKSIEILIDEDNYDKAKWILDKLNRMRSLFGRLETFIIDIRTNSMNIQELFQNKNVFSHLTGLELSVDFDPIFVQIPQICKNLKSLNLYFQNGMCGHPKFLSFLTSIQNLVHLKSLTFSWPGDAKYFWGYFKPQPALQYLFLEVSASNLINEGLFRENMEPKDVASHWEDIQGLKVLEFSVSCSKVEEMIFIKQFITMILRKVQKLGELKIWMMTPLAIGELFFVEEVSHLYESLEKIEVSQITRSSTPKSPPKMDLSRMKSFKNLKELKLQGNLITYENVDEIVSVLEENQKEGEASVLEIKIQTMLDQYWLGETLKRIEKIKKKDKSLKMLIEASFKTRHYVEVLEKLCRDIQEVKLIQGLVICLNINYNLDYEALPVEEVRGVLNKYAEIHNLELSLSNGVQSLEFRRLDGEKSSFYVENRERDLRIEFIE